MALRFLPFSSKIKSTGFQQKKNQPANSPEKLKSKNLITKTEDSICQFAGIPQVGI